MKTRDTFAMQSRTICAWQIFRGWLCAFSALLVLAFAPNVAAQDSPNIVLILADDLGFSDLGCYGGEIETPNLDTLATNGIRYSQFYNTGRCWPTRASLLTGYYAQQVRRDRFYDWQPEFKTGGQGVRPDWAPLISVALGKAGYRCYHSGKWHMNGAPMKNGFHGSYSLDDHGRFFSPKRHLLDGMALPQPARDSGYYATTAIADHTIESLVSHAEEFSDQPFFQFVAFTAPHFPLHALPEDIEKYRGKYDQGWNELRNQRWQRMQESKLFPTQLSEFESEIGPPYKFADDLAQLGAGESEFPVAWDELSDEQKRFQATKMEIHAAMVDRMDQEIGRIVEQLRSMGELENTLIVFLSDNGASAEIMIRDDGHDPMAEMGSAGSHLCLGPGWSTNCNAPFRKHKTWVHEGGIATPCIVHWPAQVKISNMWHQQVAHVIDIVPTIMEVAGIESESADKPFMPGISLLDSIQGEIILKSRELWWYHDGHKAIRDENWKLVNSKGSQWELFDLNQDRAETNDLADERSDLKQMLADKWKTMAERFLEDAKHEE